MPGAWSALVGWAVTAAIARNVGGSGWMGQPTRDLARLAARRMPPGSIDELERVLVEIGQKTGNAGLTDIFDTLRYRQQLAAAFATETHR